MMTKNDYHAIRGKALRARCDARFMQRAGKIMGGAYVSPSWAERGRVALKLALWARKEYRR